MSFPASTVFIVDDDISVRESLVALIQSAGWRAESFASAEEFLGHPPPRHTPACLLLDVALPGMDGLTLQQRLAQDRGDLPIIIISGTGDVPMTVRAMKAGAVALLTKPLAVDAVLDAVREAMDQSCAALCRAAGMRELLERYHSMSLREREVMALVVAGLLNKQVAGRLGISEITVKAHRGRVMRKMGANSLPDLVTMAASLGVRPGPEASVQRLPPPRSVETALTRSWQGSEAGSAI